MRLPVNLATKPLETHRRFLTFSLAGIMAAFLVLVGLSWHVIAFRHAQSAFRTEDEQSARQIDKLIAQREELERFFSRPENAKLHDRASFVNAVIDARSFSWTRMFADLEEVLPNGVRVLSISPKQENGHVTVKLTVGADSEDSKRTFLSELARSDAFSQVELSSVRTPQQNTGSDLLVLELTLVYSRA